MNEALYSMIFKRKSFHRFPDAGSGVITEGELEEIKAAYASFDTLYPDIKTEIRILPASKVNFRRDAEYCILIYSEKKDNYLMNAGYIGEQLDLYLVERNIGTLWFGIGRPDQKSYNGLEYVIMIAIKKIDDESLFRKDMFKAKRKPLEEIWEGESLGIAEIARFAPSACNLQPWFVKNEGGKLTVYRYKNPLRRGMMPFVLVSYYNHIDAGIYLCILELCMAHGSIAFTRELFVDAIDSKEEYTKIAEYTLS
ncbi:MAG: nitroreductase [Firmicutes bacterium]|nr:nitroreductase [Bacillota bacterium]